MLSLALCAILSTCRHILQEILFGNRRELLLTGDIWKAFQLMFEDFSLEVYQRRELVNTPVSVMNPEETIESCRLKFNELIERTRNAF